MDQSHATPTPADADRLARILELPAIREAFAADAAREESADLAARLALLDGIADREAELARATEETTDLADAIGYARRRLADLLKENIRHHEGLARAARQLQATRRELRMHGGDLISHTCRQLRARAQGQRDRAARLGLLVRPFTTRLGDIAMKPDTEANAQASAAAALADRLEAAATEIEALEHERISPQAIERAAAAVLDGLDLSIHSGERRAGWALDGWTPGKSRDLPPLERA